MPDSDKSLGQAVKQEPSDELNGSYRDLFCLIFLSIFDFESHHAVFKRHDTTVCNSDPVGIARQVFQNVFRPFDRITHIDNPFFLIQPGFKLFVFTTGKFKILTLAGPAHKVHELAAKNQRQRLLVKKIVAFAGCPT